MRGRNDVGHRAPWVHSRPRAHGFYAFLARPLFSRARFAIGALSVALATTFALPLWHLAVAAPTYPNGLTFELHAGGMQAGHGGADLRDLNVLGHFLGVKALDAEAAGPSWLPFVLGLLVVLGLRCATIGEVRSLIDLFVTSAGVAAFTIVRFVLALRTFGELDPDAPVKVQSFAPPLWGAASAGDVTLHGSLGLGAYVALGFVVGVFVVLVLHLVAGRRAQAATSEVRS